MKHTDHIQQSAETFEKWGRDYQAVAAKTDNLASRAAILREAAHYFECAARLCAVAPAKRQNPPDGTEA